MAFSNDLVTNARLREEVHRLEGLVEAESGERHRLEQSMKDTLDELNRRLHSLDASASHAQLRSFPLTPFAQAGGVGKATSLRSHQSQRSTRSQDGCNLPRFADQEGNHQSGQQQGNHVEYDVDLEQRGRQPAQPEETVQVRDPAQPNDYSMATFDNRSVTSKQLDLGDMYEPNASIWDASMFVFHPCLGPIVSTILALIWALNVVVQTYFCYIVFTFMLEDDVTSQNLTDLLRFRLSSGHNVQFADAVSQRSLTAQVCMEDRKAILAGLHLNLIDNVDEFLQGGLSLMMVAQGLWLCTMLKEVNAAWNFMRALLHLHRGRSTGLVLAESRDFDESTILNVGHLKTFEENALSTLIVVTRLTKITKLRQWAAITFIFVPRVLLAVLLGYVGVRFLGKTARNEELLLNVLALAFVNEIDELFFDIFAPRRLQALMRNLEPLPMPHKHFREASGTNCVLKLGMVAGVLFLVYHSLLRPYFWMLNQAHDIVCSGEQNFVFAQNPVTNLVHVTRSQVDAEWTELERTVVQVARPSIESRFDWSIDQDIVDQSKSEVTQAIFMVDTSAHLNNISHVDFSLDQFLAVHELSKWSTAEAAKAQSCTDLNAGIVALRALRHLMQNTSINNCQDVPWQQCAELNMTQLRALCPRRCNCDRPPLISPGYAGIFRTPASGCPAQCATLTASYNEISYQKASPYQAVDALSVHSCTDVQPEKFIHDAIQTCVNSDQFEIGVTGPAVNRDGQSCEYYYRDTHTYTEYVFNNTANESMYVTTTLENVLFYSFRGSNYEWPEFEEYCPHIYDDEDFTANDMCCACKGGGLQNRTFSSVSCSQDLEHDCHTMSPPAFWFLLYIKGLFESLNANQFFIHTLRDAVYNPAQLIGTEFYGNEELIQSVVNGSLVESLLNGKWEFMPNRSHPRGLTGCDFLTSLEFKSLLNIDLCDSSEYSSIKFLCPESCGCRPSVFSNPHGDVYFNQNFQDVTATQILDERQQIAPQTFIFSNDRVGLSECPASCTIPHRDLPGQNKGWDLFEEVEYDPSNYYWWYSDEPSSHPTPAPGEDGSSTTTVL